MLLEVLEHAREMSSDSRVDRVYLSHLHPDGLLEVLEHARLGKCRLIVA